MRNYLKGHHYGAFDEAETQMLCAAFDEAWMMLQATPHAYILHDDPAQLREILASHIVATALAGERDPVRLRTAGLLRVATKLSG